MVIAEQKITCIMGHNVDTENIANKALRKVIGQRFFSDEVPDGHKEHVNYGGPGDRDWPSHYNHTRETWGDYSRTE